MNTNRKLRQLAPLVCALPLFLFLCLPLVSSSPCAPAAQLSSGDTVHIAVPVWLINEPHGWFRGRLANTQATNITGYGTIMTQHFLLALDLYLEKLSAYNNTIPLTNGANVKLNFVVINLANKPGFPGTIADYATVDPASNLPKFMVYSTYPGIPGSALDPKHDGQFFLMTSQNVTLLQQHYGIDKPFTFIIPTVMLVDAPTQGLMNLVEDAQSAVVIHPLLSSIEDFQCDGILPGAIPPSGTPDCLAPPYNRARKQGARRYETLLGVLQSSTSNQLATIDLFRSIGVETIVVIRDAVTSITFSYWTAIQVKADAAILKLKVLETIALEQAVGCDPNRPVNATDVPEYCPPNIGLGKFQTQVFSNNQTALQVAEHIRDLNPDALIILGAPRSQASWSIGQMLASFKKIDWTPKAISFGGGLDEWLKGQWLPPDALEVIDYSLTVLTWDPRLTGTGFQNPMTPTSFELFPSTGEMDGPMVFYNEFETAYGPNASWGPGGTKGAHPMYGSEWPVGGGPLGMHAFHVAQKIIEKGLTTDVPTLLNVAKGINAPSVFRSVLFEEYGRSASATFTQVVYQYTPGDIAATRLVIPYNVGQPMIYPMPTWGERVFSQQYGMKTSDQLLLGLNSAAIFICALLLLSLLRSWESAVIRASTPFLCLIIIAGGMMMLASTYFQTSVAYPSHCEASSWLLTLGFTLTFAPLFVKTFRVYYIFRQERYERKKRRLSDTNLFAAILILLILDVVINLIWRNEQGGFVTTMQIVDPLRPALNFMECDFSASNWAVYTHIGTKGVLLLFGLCLTYLVRNAPSQFNESLYIAIAIYNVAIVVCFIIPILHAQLGGNGTVYLIRGYAILFVVLATELLLFIPKFAAVLRGQGKKKLDSTAMPLPNLAPVVITNVTRDMGVLTHRQGNQPQMVKNFELRKPRPAKTTDDDSSDVSFHPDTDESPNVQSPLSGGAFPEGHRAASYLNARGMRAGPSPIDSRATNSLPPYSIGQGDVDPRGYDGADGLSMQSDYDPTPMHTPAPSQFLSQLALPPISQEKISSPIEEELVPVSEEDSNNPVQFHVEAREIIGPSVARTNSLSSQHTSISPGPGNSQPRASNASSTSIRSSPTSGYGSPVQDESMTTRSQGFIPHQAHNHQEGRLPRWAL